MRTINLFEKYAKLVKADQYDQAIAVLKANISIRQTAIIYDECKDPQHVLNVIDEYTDRLSAVQDTKAKIMLIGLGLSLIFGISMSIALPAATSIWAKLAIGFAGGFVIGAVAEAVGNDQALKRLTTLSAEQSALEVSLLGS